MSYNSDSLKIFDILISFGVPAYKAREAAIKIVEQCTLIKKSDTENKEDLEKRVQNLEMQMEILSDTIKEMVRNDKKNKRL